MEIVLFLAFKTIWGIFRHCIRLIAMMEFLRNSIAYFTTLLYGFYVHVSSIFPKFIFHEIDQPPFRHSSSVYEYLQKFAVSSI